MDRQQILELLIGVLIPAGAGLATGVVLLLGGVRGAAVEGKGAEAAPAGGWPRLLPLAPLGIAAAYILAHWRINGGLPAWPPSGSEGRLFVVVAGVGLIGAALAAGAIGRVAAISAAVLGAAAVGAVVMWPAVQRGPGVVEIGWMVGAGVAAVLVTFPSTRLEARGRPRAAAVLLAGTAAAAGAALAVSHSMKLAQFSWAAAGAVLAAGLLGRGGTKVWLGPGLAVAACAAAASLLAGGVYSDLPWYAGAVLGVAPIAGMLAGPAIAGRSRPGRAVVASIIAAAVVAGAGVAAAAIGTTEWGGAEAAD